MHPPPSLTCISAPSACSDDSATRASTTQGYSTECGEAPATASRRPSSSRREAADPADAVNDAAVVEGEPTVVAAVAAAVVVAEGDVGRGDGGGEACCSCASSCGMAGRHTEGGQERSATCRRGSMAWP